MKTEFGSKNVNWLDSKDIKETTYDKNMKRVCNGCLKSNPIVNEALGYCQYCYEQRRVKSVTEILEETSND